MSTSTSRLSFQDCFDLLDQAIADPKGVRVKFAENGDAWQFRLRIHAARKLDRKANAETYAEDHAMYGRSAYDVITARIITDSNGIWLYLKKLDIKDLQVESLSDIKDDTETGEEPAPATESSVDPNHVGRRVL